jgi:Pyruvate/2-oxoacid:ferredoxin oxidoreductase gamma subunit
VERELLLTGIGGQGIQLAAQVLARAALAEGRSVQMFGSYGGMMRGGRTDATIVVADDAVEAPPTVGTAWSAIVMHDAYAAPILWAVRPGGLLLLNAEFAAMAIDRERLRVVDLHAPDIAEGVGNRMAASMVMIGAYAAATGIVGVDALTAAVEESLPPYRKQLAEVNVAAIRAGFDAGPRDIAPAWEPDRVTT